MNINEEKAENTPAGGVLVGKKDGQTIIHDKGTMSGYLVGKLHKDGGIKAVNKATGQPLEMQGGEVVITAPAVSDQTKREFEGKMMTNREILSAINEKGGGVSFADGGDIPAKIHTTDCEYKFGGKVVKDTDIAHSLGMNSTLKKGKQQFSSGDTTYDVDAIYNAIKKGKLRLKTKEVETFPMKYPVYDKNYAENHKIDFRKPNGITVRTESGEEVLIDGNHRMNNAYSNGRKTMKTYYVEDPKQISKFSKKNKFMIGGYNARTISSFDNPKEAIEYVDKEIVGKAVGIYTGSKFKEGGHLSKGKSLKQIAEMHNVSLAHINEELAKGLEVEKEHFSDFKERTRVAKDHLVENPNYYTILEKAGLKMGGQIQRQELVEKSKKGDTPARDLNNYNDVLDLEADGMVGADSGLAFANGGITPYDANIEGDSVDIVENGFSNGGGVELPKVSYVKVSNSGASLSNLIGNKYNSYIEFAESVEYAYKQLGTKPRSFVELQAFDENGIALIDVTTYISDQKNTIKNFNPLTGNYKNLEKSLANSRPRSFQKFNWQDWLLSKVTPSVQTTNLTNKSASTSTQSQYPEYYEYVGKLSSESFTIGKIYKIVNPNNINASQNFIDNKGVRNGFAGENDKKFKPSTEEAFLAQQSGGSSNSAQTLSSSSNQSSLEPKIVDAVNVEFVYPNGRIEMSATINISNLKNTLANFWNIVDKKSWEVRITPFENQFTPFEEKKLIIGSDFAEFNPETFSEEQLGNKLKSLYPNLDWSVFLREKTPASKEIKPFEATQVMLEWRNNLGILVYRNFYTKDYDKFGVYVGDKKSGDEFISELKNIEKQRNGKDVELTIRAYAQDNNGNEFEKNDYFNIGDSYFKPSTKTNEEIKSIVEEWIDGINFDKFFQNAVSLSGSQSNDSNSVTAISITYDSKVNINSGGISIANNPTELYQFLKGLLNGDYKNVKIQPTGNSINVNPALLYLDDFQWYSILTNNSLETALKEINKVLNIIFPELNFDSFVKANSVIKTVENTVYSLDLAVNKLEKASSTVVTEYNKEIYDKSLKFLYDTKATYELALKFTPESAFMYERLDILKKLADIEKKIKNIEDMKKGGAFYMLAKILEKLERGENWRQSESAEDVITNHIPKSEIEIIIRSQKFKNWFGDWEKALINDEYDNVSKALTDGIPSVYHHGARRIKYTYREVSNGVLYLAENISYALWFSQNATAQSEEGNYLTECFVNVKNPIDLTAFHVNKVDLADIVRYIDAVYPMAKIYDFIPAQVALLIKTNQPTNVKMWAWQLIRSYAKFVNHIKENTPYDGFLYYENNPSDEVTNPVTGQLEENVTKAVAIFKSHQVKVVDAVLFDGGLDDWRFENGGKIKN